MFPLFLHPDVAWFILRLAVATVFIYHALPKLTKPAVMASGLGFSAGRVMLLGTVESVSSIGLILGVYMQICSILLCTVMLGAMYFKMFKWHVPFFATDKTGWEFDFILLAANLAIILGGGGNIKLF